MVEDLISFGIKTTLLGQQR